MTRTRVKICGITRLTDALCAVEAGATAVGFVFWPGSPRAVRPERAAEIVARLQERIAAARNDLGDSLVAAKGANVAAAGRRATIAATRHAAAAPRREAGRAAMVVSPVVSSSAGGVTRPPIARFEGFGNGLSARRLPLVV